MNHISYRYELLDELFEKIVDEIKIKYIPCKIDLEKAKEEIKKIDSNYDEETVSFLSIATDEDSFFYFLNEIKNKNILYKGSIFDIICYFETAGENGVSYAFPIKNNNMLIENLIQLPINTKIQEPAIDDKEKDEKLQELIIENKKQNRQEPKKKKISSVNYYFKDKKLTEEEIELIKPTLKEFETVIFNYMLSNVKANEIARLTNRKINTIYKTISEVKEKIKKVDRG